ncbi:MAG: prepilin-type N-terminal cleavage/methylation domain-containing protein [Oscillibacter sp.]|nr:prepilin-type N-terminal cleavage/methylation domain-containing protein [Oscillibacter sp.]
MKRKLNKGAGFTLAELLIVVAIIAILVAIGIPVFSTAMERSRETVDLANIRAAYAEFQSAQLSGTNVVRGVYKIDFKQTDSSGWLIDTTGLKNLLATDQEAKKEVKDETTGEITTPAKDAAYSLDTPVTAGDKNKDAVMFEVTGKGKPTLTFVKFSPVADNMPAATGYTVCLSDTTEKTTDPNGKITYTIASMTKDNASYYLIKQD